MALSRSEPEQFSELMHQLRIIATAVGRTV